MSQYYVFDVHWSQTSECRTNGETSETHLRNWCIDNTLLAELVKETLGHLESKQIFSISAPLL